jgi:type II secretory pathway predicted ATPase ExeA/septal ring-binding cell division protein DamX
MDKEMFDTDQLPYKDAIDTRRFFPGGGRSELLGAIKSAISDSVTLITLIGEEGCGKTMICRMIENELPKEYIPVFFFQTLVSFEDVTHTIAQEMKITLADGVASGDVRDLLLEVRERLAERKQKMLVVFDQADRIYLATLERIRKMLDIVNQTGIVVQILFSGRNGLQDSLKQLSLCTFKGAEERHFALEPLNLFETQEYLNFQLKRGTTDEQEVFTSELSEKIFVIARGNIRTTNILADEFLQSLTMDITHEALLDNIWVTKKKEQSSIWNPAFLKEKYLLYKKFFIPAGIAFIVLIFLFIIMFKQPSAVQEKKHMPEIENLSTEVRAIQKQIKENIKEDDSSAVGQIPEKEPEKKGEEKILAPPVVSPPATEVVVEKSQPVEKKTEPVAMESLNTPPKATKQENPVGEKTPVEKVKVSVDQLFNTRVAIAAKWLVGQKNDRFTIQLMVLASESAENNIKKMLAEKEYQDVANQFFILRRAGAIPTVLVFYGEYSTMVEARNARNNLPDFLLKHNPYAISIRGAVNKANKSGG